MVNRVECIKVLVVDDHAIVREGICALLESSPEFQVVGEASDGEEALEMVSRLVPDVVLMDMVMPGMDGVEATRLISKNNAVKVLVLTQFSDREHVFQIIEAGAAGFISKTTVSSELTGGIRAVYQGDSYLCPQVAKYMVEDIKQGGQSGERARDGYSLLTGREREILKLLAEGLTTREIAEKLVVSPKTVEGHKTRLMSKLDLHNRVELVKYAFRRGIVDL